MPRSGRHTYAHRRPRRRWLVGALVLTLLIAGAVAAIFAPDLLRSSGSSTPLSPSPTTPPCPSAQLAAGDRLGSVAWVDGSSLHLLDLDTCDQRTLVADGAAPPARHV